MYLQTRKLAFFGFLITGFYITPSQIDFPGCRYGLRVSVEGREK